VVVEEEEGVLSTTAITEIVLVTRIAARTPPSPAKEAEAAVLIWHPIKPALI